MRTEDVLMVPEALDRAGVRYRLDGGWGVDALHGLCRRAHRDLDLAVDANTFGAARLALEQLGFTPETDWLPVRLELAGGPGGWVDLHPVRFDTAGHGTQQGLDETTFAYPAADLTTGLIGDRTVPCISKRLQIEFHSGYEPRPQDLHDFALLTPRGDEA